MMNRQAAIWKLAVMLSACMGVLPGLPAAEPGFETIRDVVYVQREGQPLRADIYRPTGSGPFPGVLCVHGGAWLAGDKSQLKVIGRVLAVHGYVAVAINYRLAPQHKFPAQLEDCRQAIRWIHKHAQQYKIDSGRLGGWGYSAGGQLVALLGVTGTPDPPKGRQADHGDRPLRLAAVVAGGTPCDFRTMAPDSRRLVFWLGKTRGEDPEIYRLASPAEFVTPDDPPMLLYHGEKDRVVSLNEALAMAARLRRAGVTVRMYVHPNAGHVRTFMAAAPIAEAVKFLDKYLGQ